VQAGCLPLVVNNFPQSTQVFSFVLTCTVWAAPHSREQNTVIGSSGLNSVPHPWQALLGSVALRFAYSKLFRHFIEHAFA
jgi:hypothetical protein